MDTVRALGEVARELGPEDESNRGVVLPAFRPPVAALFAVRRG